MNDALAYRQPDSSPARVGVWRQALENFEDLAEIGMLNANTVVGHPDPPLGRRLAFGRDFDLWHPIWMAVLQGVSDQVLEEADQLDLVGQHVGKIANRYLGPSLRNASLEIGTNGWPWLVTRA